MPCGGFDWRSQEVVSEELRRYVTTPSIHYTVGIVYDTVASRCQYAYNNDNVRVHSTVWIHTYISDIAYRLDFTTFSTVQYSEAVRIRRSYVRYNVHVSFRLKLPVRYHMYSTYG